MHRPEISRVAAAPRQMLPWLLMTCLLMAGFALSSTAHASSTLCSSGLRCADSALAAAPATERSLLDFAAALQLAGMTRRDELSSQEYFSFSGVGAIVCTVDGEQRMSTAFLVGAFDIGVTVAHTFENRNGETAAENCIYTSTDSLGQIRERIPVSYIKSQWRAEAGASGHAAKDFAVIRLQEPSHYAQRTMPMGRFTGPATSVLLVGFRSDMESDPLKAKSRGTVYERTLDELPLTSLEGFTHDIDARGIAAGAPVIDEHTGVIIGMHTLATRRVAGSAARNTMITMNEWLERTLRAEIEIDDAKGADSAL